MMSYYYEDAKTMYEVFRRGRYVSGKHPKVNILERNLPRWWLSFYSLTALAVNFCYWVQATVPG